MWRIIYDEYGQTGNRFISYIDSIAWGIVKKKKVVILFPERILEDYDNFRNCKFICLPLWEQWHLRSVIKILIDNRLIRRFLRSRLGARLGFYAGWDLRESKRYYPLVYDQICEIFRPNSWITEPIDQEFCKHKQKGRVIIGVHIRKGDYKEYCGGKYFYDDNVYGAFMERLMCLFKDCIFYVASNELIGSDIMKFPIIQGEKKCASGDMYALSKCDFIMGPPSTFSYFAAIIGDVPLLHIHDRNMNVDLMSFKNVRTKA